MMCAPLIEEHHRVEMFTGVGVSKERGFPFYSHHGSSLALISGYKSCATWLLITWIHGDGLAVVDGSRLYRLGRSQPAGKGNQYRQTNQ